MSNRSDTFIPAGKAIRDVVVNLAARRDQARLAPKVSRHTESMFKDSVRHLDELERARGHLIMAWKIYVAEVATVEEARVRIGAALIDIYMQPVMKQE